MTESQEPVYQFVKGAGWIVQAHESCTKVYSVAGLTRRVTITKRPPELHERGWFAYPYASASLEDTINDVIQPLDSPAPKQGIVGWPGEYHKSDEGLDQERRGWVYVVTVQSWLLVNGEWVVE